MNLQHNDTVPKQSDPELYDNMLPNPPHSFPLCACIVSGPMSNEHGKAGQQRKAFEWRGIGSKVK